MFAILTLAFTSACSTSSFFFEPVKEYRAEPDSSICATEEVSFPSGNGKRLTGWVLAPKEQPHIASVLYLHGNYGNVSLFLFPVEPLVAAGFQVLTFDYQGYGKSEGEPSQEAVLADAQAALDFAKARPDFAGLPLVVFGQSMGGHAAVALVARNPGKVDALATEGAFTGFKDEAEWTARRSGSPPGLTRAFVPQAYRALDEIGSVHVPLLVAHSVDDDVVPFSMGEELFAKANEPKTFWKVTGRHVRAAQVDPQGFRDHFLALVRTGREVK